MTGLPPVTVLQVVKPRPIRICTKDFLNFERLEVGLSFTYQKLRLALVQLNEVDNGLYAEDIEGMVTGFAEGLVHFNTVHGIVTVPLDSIRNVYIPKFRKWSEV